MPERKVQSQMNEKASLRGASFANIGRVRRGKYFTPDDNPNRIADKVYFFLMNSRYARRKKAISYSSNSLVIRTTGDRANQSRVFCQGTCNLQKTKTERTEARLVMTGVNKNMPSTGYLNVEERTWMIQKMNPETKGYSRGCER